MYNRDIKQIMPNLVAAGILGVIVMIALYKIHDRDRSGSSAGPSRPPPREPIPESELTQCYDCAFIGKKCHHRQRNINQYPFASELWRPVGDRPVSWDSASKWMHPADMMQKRSGAYIPKAFQYPTFGNPYGLDIGHVSMI